MTEGSGGAAPRLFSRNLKLRVLSSIVMIAAFVVVAHVGGLLFAALVAAGSALVLVEWIRMTDMPGSAYFRRAMPVAGGLCVLAAASGLDAAAFALLAVGGFVAAMAFAERHYAWLLAGLLYAAVPGILIVALRGSDGAGFVAILFLFCIVWATDSGAYFAGRIIGGPKLWPRVSPSKTWSGAAGGVVSAALVGVGVLGVAGVKVTGLVALVAILLSVASQLGDLAESAVKRHFAVKDSGDLIPGHGGIMDRVDGLLFAAVLAAAIGYAHAGGLDVAAGLVRW